MEKYLDIILSTLRDISEEDDNEMLKNANTKTKLFGANGALDSVGIVFLISELEEKIEDEFDVQIMLADDKAMSGVTSPFRNVESLAKYIDSLIG
ncbi:hypothetical protein [Vibrio sp. 10N.261.46.A3]|uniref:hypothetical protein n=1 Tax=Vibrio sp. 10N.261.46.A3 TaxID=3229658 RepID=UPI00354F47EF